VRAIFRAVAKDGRRMLSEPEAKTVLAAYGISVPETLVARDRAEVRRAAAGLLQHHERVVVKLISRTVSHKSDVGGVVLDISSEDAAEAAADAIAGKLKQAAPHARIDGFAVQAMIRRRGAQELILGMSRDPAFGPVILFGAGGVAVEVVDDTAMALPPLDDVLAGDLIERTRVGRLLAGFRDRKPADRKAIVAALNGLSQMVVDFPCVVSVDVNPLLADADGVIALDARIEIDPQQVEAAGPNPRLAIRPYPAQWEKEIGAGGSRYRVRPIKPADIRLYPDFLARVSQEDMRLRFLLPVRTLPETMLKRLTQLDYEREMAFVALEASGELAAVARLSANPDRSAAEYALLVRTDLQGHGLGWSLLSHVIDYARAEGIGLVRGIVLKENHRMLDMCRELGFSVASDPDEPRNMLVSLAL
jgi:acetyltransferase